MSGSLGEESGNGWERAMEEGGTAPSRLCAEEAELWSPAGPYDEAETPLNRSAHLSLSEIVET